VTVVPGMFAEEPEVDGLMTVLAGEGPIPAVLDLVGGHGAPLVDAGYEVVVAGPNHAPGRTFAVAIMMGLMLGRQPTGEAVRERLRTAHRWLRPGGLLLFDILDGSAVLRHAPSGQFTPVAEGTTRIVRCVRGTVDPEEGIYRVDAQVWRLDTERVLGLVEESHVIRFFLPRELELILELGGFRLLDTAPAGELGRLGWARRR
jgi:hypothetical protein